jgi:ribosomal protein L7/L12
MGLGPIEILVILGFVALFALIVAIIVLAARAGATSSHSLAWRSNGLPPPISTELYEQVLGLVRVRRKIEAIRVVRLQTGATLREAKTAVDAIAAGTYTTAPREDLAARVRALKADGRAAQAILLVRGETGMSQAEAETFVEAIG